MKKDFELYHATEQMHITYEVETRPTILLHKQ